ncbi:MAG: SOS response-associated peptidase [Lewinellaceae bacterium]|nr:SOS response-associated peptidase [Lewinellaceae bacterium]
MCGRYSFAPKPKQIDAQLRDIQRPLDLKISFNIAPTQQAYVIANDQPGHLQQMQWGLVPHWSASGANAGKLINARSEGIEEKPSFGEPIRSRRCLVPADSFYEWRSGPGRKKIPYRIHLKSDDLMFMAGIWDEWKKGKESVRSFSIITTAPNREMETLHNRMPVLLRAEQQHLWLSSLPLDEVLSLLTTPADGSLDIYRVSEKVNGTGYDEADLHDAVPEQPTLFG